MQFVSEDLNNYCINHSSKPHHICDELEAYTKTNDPNRCQMLIGKLEASLMGFLLKTIDAKNVLEIGTYTGYSALAMAENIPSDGQLHTIDVNTETTALAKKYWEKSEHGKKITQHIGPALDILETIDLTFDFVFIDADKANYLNYLKKIDSMTHQNSIIVIDNCLWSGRILDESDQSNATVGIKKVNDYVAQHDHYYSTMLPIRDGMLLIRKK